MDRNDVLQDGGLTRAGFFGNSNGWIESVAASAPLTSLGFVPNSAWAKFTQLQTPPIPEPATWAMMPGGFGLLGRVMRSARRRITKVTFANG
jgi:hypothetical protein